MDHETKTILTTFLRGREYLFFLIHRMLGAEPDKVLLEAVCSEKSLKTVLLFDSDDSAAARELHQILQGCCHQTEPECLEKMREEYTRLFIGPETLIAPPWESVYITKERALFQESTLEVRNWYRKYGYLPEKYPRVADDHISLMTHFLSLTCAEAAVCLENDRQEECLKILADQKQFEKEHLLNWICSYVDDIQASETRECYPQFVKAAAEFIAYDNRIIDELMENIRL